MRTWSLIAAVACCGCMVGGLAQAAPRPSEEPAETAKSDATPRAVFQRDLACAATAAALAARLPPRSPAATVEKARETAARERAFAIDAGARVHVPAPQVNGRIAQRRDGIAAGAAKGVDPSRALAIGVVECAFDHLGDAIKAAKAKGAGQGSR